MEAMPMPKARSESQTAASRHTPRYKARQLMLGEGDRLVLEATGTIARIAPDGTRQSWAPGDPEWPRYAIRFGLRTPVATPNPHGRDARRERSSRT
jgi:hypothetical protein